MKTIYIEGHWGFGDNLVQFPFIKEIAKHYSVIYLRTPFPFLYDTIPNVKFIVPKPGNLIAQRESVQEHIKCFVDLPTTDEYFNFQYRNAHKQGISTPKAFLEQMKWEMPLPIDWTIPIKAEWIQEVKKIGIKTDKRICLVKLPSVRKDWKNTARVPKPEYFQFILDKYKNDYYFISIADTNIDILLGNFTGIALKLENKELTLGGILALASMSDLILTYDCFMILLGAAVKTKMFALFGGYAHPSLLLPEEYYDLSQTKYVAPDPFCRCLNLRHATCNKEIPLDKIGAAFNELSNIKPSYEITTALPTKKQNLLINRLRAERCERIYDNKHISKYFNIFTLDHAHTDKYKALSHKFKMSWTFPYGNLHLKNEFTEEQVEVIFDFCKKVLTDGEIDVVINAQPLHTFNEQMKKACEVLGVENINAEAFCDDKLILDRKGCQYTPENEIYEYASKIKFNPNTVIDLPKSTRQPQPPTISKEDFWRKYKVPETNQVVVLLGQLMWDMSVKKSTNIEATTYQEYLHQILKHNSTITFIVKPHPIDIARGQSELIDICKSYKNTILVNESLDTLFSIFKYFASFSSTTIIEGLIKNKRFATMGYHFCNNDSLVYQIRTKNKFWRLLSNLQHQQIDESTLQRYLLFVCNYYAISMDSDKLMYRLLLPSDEYFADIIDNKPSAKLSETIRENLFNTPLPEMFKQVKSIAVVGNAESILNSNHGQKIDEHDLVIRMNQGKPINPIAQGNKTDFLCVSRWHNYEDSDFHLSTDKVAHLTFKERKESFDNGVRYFLPEDLRRELTRKLHTSASCGLSILYWLYSRLPEGIQVSIFGFDGKKTKSFYEQIKWEATHNWDEETELIKSITKEKGWYFYV